MELKREVFSWGVMRTIIEGSSYSIPIHPDMWLRALAGESFTDETGTTWSVLRMGGTMSFNDGRRFSILSADQVEELAG